ncbi:MAG: membrane lipoprotein lipid attachment site-containing protein [Bacteroidales bacterium]|nr:membrane lipoprotein lipid attachment site-containing protein [Bacteroidales bacterium]
MKKSILAIVILFVLSSCSLFEKRICSGYESDATTFRAHANAISTDTQFAQEKALFIAKQNIAEEVDIYILDKFDYQTFLADPLFEQKLTTARKTILSDISIICSKTIPKKELFKSYVAIEISKETIDRELKRRLQEETQ